MVIIGSSVPTVAHLLLMGGTVEPNGYEPLQVTRSEVIPVAIACEQLKEALGQRVSISVMV